MNARYLWHTSCGYPRVAKKYQTQNLVRGASEIAAMNIRLPIVPSGNTGNTVIPPRAKKVHVPRRRLEIVSFPEAVQSVKIIHTVQKLDTLLPDLQPVQSQCI